MPGGLGGIPMLVSVLQPVRAIDPGALTVKWRLVERHKEIYARRGISSRCRSVAAAFPCLWRTARLQEPQLSRRWSLATGMVP